MRKMIMAAVGMALALAACNKPQPKEADAAAIARAAAAQNAAMAAPTSGEGTRQIVTTTTVQGLKLGLPAPSVAVAGRTATVSLPFRTADKLAWTLTPGTTDPWKLTTSTVSAGKGPEGSDLAVFVFQTPGPGSATLLFRLGAPNGAGTPAKTYQATVSAS
jgi:hypothetical protein